MIISKRSCGVLAVGVISILVTHAASAGVTTVNATDSVYAVGTQAGLAGTIGGTAPLPIAIVAGTTDFTFSASGSVTVNSGGNYNNADGVGSASPETNLGTSYLSGITAPTAGYIAGVFIAAGGPTGSVPAALDFTNAGIGTSFATLSPLLNQVFFIGDGLTGNGTGATQLFYVPSGAGALYLGLADACGYYGYPGCLSDNSGSFAVTYNEMGSGTPPVNVPEASSLLLLGTAVVAMMALARKRTGYSVLA